MTVESAQASHGRIADMLSDARLTGRSITLCTSDGTQGRLWHAYEETWVEDWEDDPNNHVILTEEARWKISLSWPDVALGARWEEVHGDD